MEKTIPVSHVLSFSTHILISYEGFVERLQKDLRPAYYGGPQRRRGSTEGIVPRLEIRWQVVLPRHMQGIVIAEVLVQHQVGRRGQPQRSPAAQPKHAGDTQQFRRQAVRTAWLCSCWPLGRPERRLGRDGACFRFPRFGLAGRFSASLRTTCSTRTGNGVALHRCSPRTTRRRPARKPACHTDWQRTDPGHRCGCRLWWPRPHRPPGGRHRLDGRHADERTPKTG